MNFFKKCLCSIALVATSSIASASVISFNDIDGGVSGINISDNTGGQYRYVNVDALLDGNFSTSVQIERFIGFGPGLGQGEQITIAADFTGLYNVQSFGIAHDWGNTFAQQVSALTFTVFNDAGVAFTSDYNGLINNTFDVIDLFSGSVENATGFAVTITALQNANFEIRELVIGATQVSAPLTALLFLFGAGGLLASRRK